MINFKPIQFQKLYGLYTLYTLYEIRPFQTNFLFVALESDTDRVRKLDFYSFIPHCMGMPSCMPCCNISVSRVDRRSHP